MKVYHPLALYLRLIENSPYKLPYAERLNEYQAMKDTAIRVTEIYPFPGKYWDDVRDELYNKMMESYYETN